MNKKEAVTQLEIMATNATGRLCEAKSEEEKALLNKQIEALNMGIDAIRWRNSLILISSGTVEEPIKELERLKYTSCRDCERFGDYHYCKDCYGYDLFKCED